MATVLTTLGQFTAYNGVALEKPYYIIKIPAGNATFTVHMMVELFMNTYYKADDMEFDYSFEAGKEYTVSHSHTGDFRPGDTGVWGVNIYDGRPRAFGRNGHALNADDIFIEFVPFKNQPEF
jgi:hypothetical protein